MLIFVNNSKIYHWVCNMKMQFGMSKFPFSHPKKLFINFKFRYFTNHIQRYEQQLKAFKNQFQQLDDYFKAHDSNYNYDPQSIKKQFLSFFSN